MSNGGTHRSGSHRDGTGRGGTHKSVANRTKPVRLAPADVLGLGLLGIRTRKARAALSALGISIGIATMIIVMGIPASSQEALLERLSALGTNMLQATADPGQNPPVVFPPESPDMVARIGPVTVASAVANTNTVVARSDKVDPDNDTGLAVLAGKLNLLQAINGKVQSGRFLDAATERFPTTVLGSAAASRLGITTLPTDRPGPQVYIDNHWFTVIGILAPVPLAPDIDHSVLVGWDAAKAQLGFNGNPTVIYVQSRESQIEAVRAVMPATIDPQQPGLVQVSRPSDALAAKRETQTAFSALFLGLAGVALLVGGIGVANTMVISVLERRKEIGLRRALGANRGQIRGQFLAESVALSGLGGVAGTAIGALVTFGYATSQGWPLVIPLQVLLGGIGGAVVVGVVAGVYPSIRASRLTPTEALAST
ncbi:ABC transporter permease [Kitasatospora acidiphila]|uniref:ABC transporter permease n=1 Tax=Kitasatospora acidiphila TaxID=2567942 RepID=A0A540W5Z4_9ACTN|nr:ABC transporter permease [Kitasatospora acidiphila]TQF04436.1 ABC transporter permease [Kitasatospora acidiphila]